MNTIKRGRLSTFDKTFQKPNKFDFQIQYKDARFWSLIISDRILNYKWDNKRPTTQKLEKFKK